MRAGEVLSMHFTYNAAADPYSLLQGDLLKRTPQLNEVLATVFPHYNANPDNRLFIVVTQSCDLVLRDGRCKSPYITIASVRPLALVLEREILRYQHDPLERALHLCNKKHFPELAEFMERLLNNNESRYFFLRKDNFAGLDTDHCAFLQLSIPLKAERHYQTLLAAKVAQLSDPFQHKLAYLVGQMFGRIATEDWVPDHASPDEFDALKKEPLEPAAAWIPTETHTKVLRALKALPEADRTVERLEHIVDEISREREGRLAEVLDEVESVFSDLGVAANVVQTARKYLKNRATFTARIK